MKQVFHALLLSGWVLTCDHVSCANSCVSTGQVGRSAHTRLIFHNGDWGNNNSEKKVQFFSRFPLIQLFGGLELTKVGVVHGLPGCQPGLMVVAQQLVEKIQCLRADEVLVLAVDEPLPPLTGVSAMKTHFRNHTRLKEEPNDSVDSHLPRMSLKRGSSSMLYLSM